MYKRVVLKLSGEALAAGRGFGVDPIRIHEIGAELAEVHAMGVEIAVVVGGGNFFRGVAQQARKAYHYFGTPSVTCEQSIRSVPLSLKTSPVKRSTPPIAADSVLSIWVLLSA